MDPLLFGIIPNGSGDHCPEESGQVFDIIGSLIFMPGTYH